MGFVILKQRETQLWECGVSNELLFLKGVKFSKWVLYSQEEILFFPFMYL